MRIILTLLLGSLLACTGNPPGSAPNTWEEIETSARGTTVRMMMWMGDPQITAYLNDHVIPYVQKKYGITLEIVPGQGSQIVQQVIAQKQAGRSTGQIDLCWINGETFYQLQQLRALFGPFVHRLPNARYINATDPFISEDFGQKINGYECPWGTVQLAIIYDSLRTTTPPETIPELEQWITTNPGRFTIPTEFTGMTLLKSWMIALAGPNSQLSEGFTVERYDQAKRKLFDFLKRVRPYLWKQGTTFPTSVAEMHRLFQNGEIDFTISNNDSEVENKVSSNVFAKTSKAYVPQYGTIRNSHYQGILSTSKNYSGAVVVCNALISAELQAKKMDPRVWGDGTVLNTDLLPKSSQMLFTAIPNRTRVLPSAELRRRAHMEIAPEYMIRLFSDFRTEIIEQQ
jgi:putative spermidine/putrescine transport system substrate-binding protein